MMKTLLLAFTLAVVLFGAGPVQAQPGDQRTPKQIRQQLKAKVEELSGNINHNPESVFSYIERAATYTELCRRSQNPDEKADYADRAYQDFANAIALQPTDYSIFVKRAELRQAADWLKNFDATIEDYFEAIRLGEKSNENPTRSDFESPAPVIYKALSGLYMNRAEAVLARSELRIQSSPWDDFDTATTYAQKSVRQPRELWNVVGVRLQKGNTAYKVGEYAVALDAFYGDEKYLGDNYNLLCRDSEEQDPNCAYQKRDVILVFSMKRARVYLKLNEAGRALAELETYFNKAYELPCPEPYLLRAEANRRLGNDGLAKADEEVARKLPELSSGACDEED